MRETTRKKIAPMVITAVVVLVAAPWAVLVLSALGIVVQVNFAAALVLLALGAFGAAVVVGVVQALIQRLEEIDGGEEEEAGRY